MRCEGVLPFCGLSLCAVCLFPEIRTVGPTLSAAFRCPRSRAAVATTLHVPSPVSTCLTTEASFDHFHTVPPPSLLSFLRLSNSPHFVYPFTDSKRLRYTVFGGWQDSGCSAGSVTAARCSRWGQEWRAGFPANPNWAAWFTSASKKIYLLRLKEQHALEFLFLRKREEKLR